MEYQTNKYHDGKIYALRSFQTPLYYVGSTTQTLSRRLAGHRRDYKNHINNNTCKIYHADVMKYDDVYIELIEYYKCNTRDELLKREGELIREKYNEITNKNKPSRTKEEYIKYNNDMQKKPENIQQRKQYAILHRDEYKEKYGHHGKKKYICNICQMEMLNTHKYSHVKTKSHIDNVHKNE